MVIDLRDSTREEVRARLRKMTDAQLYRSGKAARYMCSPEARYGGDPLPTFVMQLEECIAEWRERHPPAKNSDTEGQETREVAPPTPHAGSTSQ